MFKLLYPVGFEFLVKMTKPLNEGEVDQPPPLEDQREKLVQELIRIDQAIAKRKVWLKNLREEQL